MTTSPNIYPIFLYKYEINPLKKKNKKFPFCPGKHTTLCFSYLLYHGLLWSI